jgi:hypothetical protein
MQKTEIGPNASTPVDQWRFELSNKSNLPITVSVLRQYDSHNESLVDETALKPKDKLRIQSLNNILFDIILKIAYPLKNNTNNMKNIVITIPATGIDKQILIKFLDGVIMPQIGTWSGLSGKTESGIAIVNNVTEKDIVGNKKIDVVDHIFDF